MEITDPRIRIRTRYLEALRAGANIHDATEYANASNEDRPKFIPINVDIPMAPKGYGKPGEIEQLLPTSFAKIKTPIAALPSTDPELELVRRPMVEQPSNNDPMEATVAETVVTEPAPVTVAIELPEGWDTKDFTWPQLRALCIQVAMKTPHSRTDAVNLIRKSTGE